MTRRSTETVCKPDPHGPYVVDTTEGKDSLWLMKVPNYLSELWMREASKHETGEFIDVADFVVYSPLGANEEEKNSMRLISDKVFIEKAGDDAPCIPQVFEMSKTIGESGSTSDQSFLVLCESNQERDNCNLKAYSLYGYVSEKLNCKALECGISYAHLAKSRANKKNIKRQAKHIGDALQTQRWGTGYDIIVPKRNNVERRVCMSREEIERIIFKTFEEERRISMKDLIIITGQSRRTLKPILEDIAISLRGAGNRTYYELKPEFTSSSHLAGRAD